MNLTEEQVAGLAPDDASVKAGVPDKFPDFMVAALSK